MTESNFPFTDSNVTRYNLELFQNKPQFSLSRVPNFLLIITTTKKKEKNEKKRLRMNESTLRNIVWQIYLSL